MPNGTQINALLQPHWNKVASAVFLGSCLTYEALGRMKSMSQNFSDETSMQWL